MKHTIKRISYTLILVLFLLIAGLTIFISQVNLNDYKKKLDRVFFEKTGLHLVINGDIKWQLFPSAGLTVSKTDVTNQNKKTLFSLQSATADIDIIPLFFKDIRINNILVKKVNLNIVKMVSGKFNFQGNINNAETSQPLSSFSGAKESHAISKNEKEGFNFKIKSIRKISFDNFNIFYQDQGKKQRLSLKNGLLHATNLTSGNEFPLLMSFTIDSDQPTFKMNVNLKGRGVVDLNKQVYAIDDLNMTMKPGDTTSIKNDFTLSGNLAVKDKKLLFNLGGSELNLHDFMSAASGENQQKTAALAAIKKPVVAANITTKDSRDDSVIIPASLIRALNMEGVLSLVSLNYNNFIFNNPELTIKVADGIAEITPLKTGFLGGSITAKMKINAQQTLPHVSINASADGVEVKKLHHTEKLEGKAYTDVRLLTQGETLNDLIRALNGEVSFHIDQGQLNSINIDRLVCGMIAKVRRKKMSKKEWPTRTRFEALKGKWNVNNGIASNNDLRATLSSMELRGDGWVNLMEQTIDYHLNLTVTGNTKDSSKNNAACEINPRYADLSWPIRCEGKLGQPNLCRVDSERFGKLIQAVLQREAEHQLKKELKKHLKSPLNNIKGLFN